MKVLATGLNGLVGSRIQELLPHIEFISVSRHIGFDVTDEKTVLDTITKAKPDAIFHIAAMTNVDGAEKEKDRGKESESWKVNVEGTKHVVRAGESIGKKIIYISTDFVFDGENPPGTGYTEEDTPHPINWYGQTKYEGEKLVQKSHVPWSILRIASPYRAQFEKNDFVRAMLGRLKNGEEVQGVSDIFMTPTYIDDIAPVARYILEEEASGIYHVVGDSFISPYDTAQMIARTFGIPEAHITPVLAKDFFGNRAKRPYKSLLNNAKIERLGFQMKTFGQGLQALHEDI